MKLIPLVAELRRIRIEADLPLRVVAEKLGCSVQIVGAWELGTQRPRIDLLIRWAAALGYDLTLARRIGASVEEVPAAKIRTRSGDRYAS